MVIALIKQIVESFILAFFAVLMVVAILAALIICSPFVAKEWLDDIVDPSDKRWSGKNLSARKC